MIIRPGPEGPDLPTTIKDIIVGKARDPMDPRIFHNVSLAAFLAWVGLGADGLSSSGIRSRRGVQGSRRPRLPAPSGWRP